MTTNGRGEPTWQSALRNRRRLGPRLRTTATPAPELLLGLAAFIAAPSAAAQFSQQGAKLIGSNIGSNIGSKILEASILWGQTS